MLVNKVVKEIQVPMDLLEILVNPDAMALQALTDQIVLL